MWNKKGILPLEWFSLWEQEALRSIGIDDETRGFEATLLFLILRTAKQTMLLFVYKDDAYNSIKDIGVDEGMLTLEKVWIKSRDSQEMEDVPAFLDDLSLVNEH